MNSKNELKKGVNFTFDGLSRVLFARRTFLKIAWSMALLTSLSSCAYVLTRGVLSYLAYDIVTTITVRSETPAKLPRIIVCNSNALTTDTGIAFATQVFAQYGITVYNNYIHYQNSGAPASQLITKGNILVPRTMVLSASRDPLLSDAFRQSLGLTMRDMLLSCTFNDAECTAENFDWLYDSYYGNCFQFNASANGPISQSGKFSGLSMELFAGETKAVQQMAMDSGVHVFIVNETVTINPFSQAAFGSAGKETSVFIDKQRVKKMETPYGECTPDLTDTDSYPSELYRLTFEIYATYRQSDCINTCFQQFIVKNLSCYSASFPYLKNATTPACLEGLNLFNSLSLYTLFYIEDVATKCLECPLECDSEYYMLTTSSLDYPTRIYAQMLAQQSQIQSRFNNRSPTYGQLKQSLASVNINYNQLAYTQIKEIQRISLLDLITNIGGTMGLFVGFSFISLFEIVELLIFLVYMILHRFIILSNFFLYI